ncbi:hypothetical protein GGX14DRAFT_409225 [Mycena pura]|uniref:Uncharacterized protein n=1 Tax=Mycena pura TaxID=153505 RepID=A0AAD6XV90_9AGAR|nr:hypothetical protein GGX14DRAFT_409225 [Mycena pura]
MSIKKRSEKTKSAWSVSDLTCQINLYRMSEFQFGRGSLVALAVMFTCDFGWQFGSSEASNEVICARKKSSNAQAQGIAAARESALVVGAAQCHSEVPLRELENGLREAKGTYHCKFLYRLGWMFQPEALNALAKRPNVGILVILRLVTLSMLGGGGGGRGGNGPDSMRMVHYKLPALTCIKLNNGWVGCGGMGGSGPRPILGAEIGAGEGGRGGDCGSGTRDIENNSCMPGTNFRNAQNIVKR